MYWMIQTGKTYLETLLQPVDSSYRCIAFRAGNWAMQPSSAAISALLANGIRMDSSVYKFGKRNYPVTYDYADADSAVLPWPVAHDDICRRDEAGELIEVPIYSEYRTIMAFASVNRGYRVAMSLRNRIPDTTGKKKLEKRTEQFRHWLDLLQKKHAWKADFNQCSGQQMLAALNRIIPYRNDYPDRVIPYLMMGHSKLYNIWNTWSLNTFFTACQKQPETIRFDTLSSIYPELETLRLEKRL
jgi:hypothetical protein